MLLIAHIKGDTYMYVVGLHSNRGLERKTAEEISLWSISNRYLSLPTTSLWIRLYSAQLLGKICIVQRNDICITFFIYKFTYFGISSESNSNWKLLCYLNIKMYWYICISPTLLVSDCINVFDCLFLHIAGMAFISKLMTFNIKLLHIK